MQSSDRNNKEFLLRQVTKESDVLERVLNVQEQQNLYKYEKSP